jgi:hypothetical protein
MRSNLFGLFHGWPVRMPQMALRNVWHNPMWEVQVWFLGCSTVMFLLWLGINLADLLESAPDTGLVVVVVLYARTRSLIVLLFLSASDGT